MPNWLLEFLSVLSFSKKTQWSIILAFVSFIGIHLLGDYMISNFELNGPMKGFQDVIARKIAKRYDKIAVVSFFSFLVVAYRSYKKDKKRFW